MIILMMLARFSKKESSTYTHLVDLCIILSKYAQIIVLTEDTHASRTFSHDNIIVYFIPKRKTYGVDFFSWVYKAIQIIKEHNITLIYGHILPKILISALIASKVTNRPTVFWHAAHNVQENQGSILSLNHFVQSNIIDKIILKASLTYCDCLLTGTRAKKYYYVNKYGVNSNSVRIIPNYVDVNRFSPSNKSASLYGELGVSDDDFILVFVGALSPRKGLKYLLESVALLSEDITNLKLLVVGGHIFNKLEESRRISHYRSLSIDLGVGANVVFTGSIPNEILPGYLNMSDIFILPTLGEGFPRVLIEAMACGKPVVVSSFPGIEEIITTEYNGFIANPRDAKSLTNIILFLFKNRPLLSVMGKRSRSIVKESFSLKSISKKYIRVFRKIQLEYDQNAK